MAVYGRVWPCMAVCGADRDSEGPVVGDLPPHMHVHRFGPVDEPKALLSSTHFHDTDICTYASAALPELVLSWGVQEVHQARLASSLCV